MKFHVLTFFQVKPIILFKFKKLRRKKLQQNKESVSMKNVPTFYISVCFQSISQKSPGSEGSEEPSSLWEMRRLLQNLVKDGHSHYCIQNSQELPCKSRCSEAIPLLPDAIRAMQGGK